MHIAQYQKEAKQAGFEAYPLTIHGGEPALGDFIDFYQTTIELKIYLAELILCRCFPATGGIPWYKDADWMIAGFLSIYEKDPVKSFMTEAIREAIEMIQSGEDFTKGVIGTTFMFGILEHYAKYKIGFRPNNFDFFDGPNQRRHRNTFIGDAFNKLKKNKYGHRPLANRYRQA